MTLVYDKKVGGPATHAIVIGVGAYKHLVGGHEKLFRQHEGMGQLKSPPLSAQAFSDWLTSKYDNPARELASVELLVSDGSRTGKETASMSNVVRAVYSWMKRGNENQDNLMIFFFCGHGICGGPITTLLPDNYGANELSPLKNVIDFHRFHLGMDQCNALKQCYFIDACRTTSDVLQNTWGFSGDPILSPPFSLSGTHQAPIYYSASLGAATYSLPNATSPFTDALIRTLNGAGGTIVNGEWWVTTLRIPLGIDALMQRCLLPLPLPRLVETDNLSGDFLVNRIHGEPSVPVTIGCNPVMANQDAELSYRNITTVTRRERKAPCRWEVEISPDRYEFEATFPNRSFIDRKKSELVYPPVGDITINVERGGL